ncbi:FtsX-like permease family protein [bacterium]|nr:FtsX-like permease family protein [bacterium]
MIAVTSLIAVNSIVSGFEMEIKEKILQNEPHIIILPKNSAVTEEQFYQQIDKIKNIKNIEVITPYISSTVLISSFNNMNAVKVNGIEPKIAKKAYGIFRTLKKGSLNYIETPNQAYIDMKRKDDQFFIFEKIYQYMSDLTLNSEEREEIVNDISILINRTIEPPTKTTPCVYIGKALSESLALQVGEELKLITPFGDIGPTGVMPKTRKFRICGVFFTSLYEFDQYNIYMPIKEAQKFLGITQITGIEIKVNNIYKSDQTVSSIEKKIDLESFSVSGFSKMNKNLFSALQIEKTGMFLLLALVILVSSFNIIATLTLIVNSKRKEISILKSLGMTNSSVRKIFLYKGMIIGFIGILIGSIGGAVVTHFLKQYKMDENLYYIPNLPIRVNLVEISIIIAITFIVTVLASIVPANRAAKITPVYGLKGE